MCLISYYHKKREKQRPDDANQKSLITCFVNSWIQNGVKNCHIKDKTKYIDNISVKNEDKFAYEYEKTLSSLRLVKNAIFRACVTNKNRKQFVIKKTIIM